MDAALWMRLTGQSCLSHCGSSIMKRQPKWIAALFAVLLALCSIYQTAQAQTPPASEIVGTYVRTLFREGENTIVLRVKQQEQGQALLVYGILTRIEQNQNVILAITGEVDPNTHVLRAVLAPPPALRRSDSPQSVIGGAYLKDNQAFRLEFPSQRPGQAPLVSHLLRYTDDRPFLVGIWQWSAAADSATLATAPPYSGEFYILEQKSDNSITGHFSGGTPADTGSIATGEATPGGVYFERTGTANGQAFKQLWSGQATGDILGHTESLQGGINQTDPSPWRGEFIARWDLLR